MLTDEQVLALWQKHRTSKDMSGWRRSYAAWLQYFLDVSDDDFATAAAQKRLWDERAAGTLSWADTAVDLTPLHTDQDLIQLLVEIRRAELPADLDARAAMLSERFEAVLARVRHVAGGYAFARVSRAFAALTPRDTHAGHVASKATAINLAVCGNPFQERPHEGRVRACARVQALLGPPSTRRWGTASTASIAARL